MELHSRSAFGFGFYYGVRSQTLKTPFLYPLSCRFSVAIFRISIWYRLRSYDFLNSGNPTYDTHDPCVMIINCTPTHHIAAN